MAEIVNVTDTFSFWREQFNALVGEVSVSKYFKTPQNFGATGNGTTDDTNAFDVAVLSSEPIYVPPGTYYLTKNYTGNNKFFSFGGVNWSGSGLVNFTFVLDPTQNLTFNKVVGGVTPVLGSHLTTKSYVDGLVNTEISARQSADSVLTTNLNNEISARQSADSVLTTNLNNLTNNVYSKTDSDTLFGYFTGVRSVNISATNDLFSISDTMQPSDMTKVVNYSFNSQGWAQVRLPNLNFVQPNKVIHISNTSLLNASELRIVPVPGQKFYNQGNIFYPDGVVKLRGGDSCTLVSTSGGFWWVLSVNKASLNDNYANMCLNFVGTIGSVGNIVRSRGFLGLQITKGSTGIYKIDWQEDTVFGDQPQIFVSVHDAADSCTAVHALAGNTQATVRIFQNGYLADKTFDILIAYPTSNKYKPM